jgi:hypothetical protein
MSPLLNTVNCWICETSLQLENRKIDEYGLAVHERCDAARVALGKAIWPETRKAHGSQS